VVQSQPDPELGRRQLPFIKGTPSVANFIANELDYSVTVFPAFHRVSARNLLHLEAELHDLQKEQDDLDIQDSRGDPDTLQYFRNLKKLSTSTDKRQMRRKALVVGIRAKIKEYRAYGFASLNCAGFVGR